MSYRWGTTAEYIQYCERMRGNVMGQAYRCDKCGEFRDGYGHLIQAWDSALGQLKQGEAPLMVALCPDCAAPIRTLLKGIAKTEHGS